MTSVCCFGAVLLFAAVPLQDQPPTAGGITWKDWVALNIQAKVEPLAVLIEERSKSTAHALVVAEKAMTTRLDNANHLISQMADQAATFATKESTDALREQIDSLQRWRSAQEGDLAGKQRGSEPMLNVVWIMVAGVIGAAISLAVSKLPQRKGST